MFSFLGCFKAASQFIHAIHISTSHFIFGWEWRMVHTWNSVMRNNWACWLPVDFWDSLFPFFSPLLIFLLDYKCNKSPLKKIWQVETNLKSQKKKSPEDNIVNISSYFFLGFPVTVLQKIDLLRLTYVQGVCVCEKMSILIIKLTVLLFNSVYTLIGQCTR